ncbi:MAG: hypothetical protein HY675_26435 [Chloroflexi bacterium]|nr:hypothetical protein [Chloroflexota bacterium]
MIALDQEQVLEDVLSNTQQVTRVIRLLSSRLAIPVLRGLPSDRLCLRTIGWLHAAHPETVDYPPAFGDGPVAIWPFLDFAPIYFFPCIEQRGLLYQPLFFHEFGHLLYACHKAEMDDLVGELQTGIGEVLTPASQCNDRHSETQIAQRQVIVDTWYSWAQEIFCDAVGFSVGGPCFLHAFSAFLSTMDRGDFYRHPQDLRMSDHPVTWLRVRFLVERACAAGFSELSKRIETEWRKVAKIMGVDEDYHGFYDEAMAPTIKRIVDDMLIEAAPRRCTDVEATGGEWNSEADSFVRLLNWAWQVYGVSPEEYASWESMQLELLLR